MGSPASNRSTQPETSRRHRRSRNELRIVCGVLAGLSIATVIAAWVAFTTRDDRTATTVPPNSASGVAGRSQESAKGGRQARADAHSAGDITVIDDDGRTLWASPTRGEPLNLAYLPAGVQFIVALRLDALAAHPEGGKVLASLGPLGELALDFLNDAVAEPNVIAHCILGCQQAAEGSWQTTIVAQLRDRTSAAEHLQSQTTAANTKTYRSKTYRVVNEWAYYLPDNDDDTLLVAAPVEIVEEIIDLNGSAPPLRRDVERLLAHTDADRHVTVLCAPSALFSEGRTLFTGPLETLKAPLYWFLGDELSAAALSMHWDDNFFVELIAAPTLEISPERAARILAARLAEVPERLEAYVVGLNPHPYGRRVVARFPGMVRKLATHTRSGFEPDHAVLRSYLPGVAGHNLLMGAELTLAESLGSGSVATVTPADTRRPAEAGSPTGSAVGLDVAQRLRRITSLSFARDTLESALEQLSQDIDVEIVILGTDLQAEGITKNQSFGIEMTNRPAEEILVEVLRLANPAKTAIGPSDERQKLVYVFSAPAGTPPQIRITTRARAAERGDELPAVFRPN
jgi:hypothetical protein